MNLLGFERNIFMFLLYLLGVKFNRTFTRKYYEQHPYKYSLYGLSSMLKNYGVASKGLRITDKNDLFKLPLPFIANFSNEFVLVNKITSDYISFLWRDRIIKISIAQFNESWSGIVLLADKLESSIEPNYKINLIQEWYTKGVGRMSVNNNCYHLGLDEEKCNGDCEIEINQARGAIILKGKCQIDSTSEVITACACVVNDPV